MKVSEEISYRNGQRHKRVNGEWVEYPYTDEEQRAADARIQDMVRCGRTPAMSGTTWNFVAHRQHNEDFDKLSSDAQKKHLASCKAMGVDISGKVRIAGLASYPDDPTAWVSDEFDARAVAEAKGLRMSEGIDYEPTETSKKKRLTRHKQRWARQRAMREAEDRNGIRNQRSILSE
jgi:hypothetical protein